jgi:chemotaxis protein histidine kinase CheA
MGMEDFFQELVRNFEIEAGELVEGASAAVLELESGQGGPAEIADRLNRLGRHLHTLKGSSATCGLLDCSELSHKLEDLIAPFKKAGEGLNPEVADLVLKGLDVLMSRVRAHAKGQGKVLGNVKAALPELWTEEAPAAPVHAAAKEGARAEAPAAPRTEEEAVPSMAGDSPVEAEASSWRVDQRHILNMLREVERLRELRLGLMDRGRDLGKTLEPLEKEAYGEDAKALKLSLQRMKVELSHDIEAAGAVIEMMEEHLKAIYTVPVGKALEGLQRAVRDACRATGKQAKLSVAGGELTLDKRLLEALYAPLVHLLRNAVDHGLEPPEERDAKGKHREGALVLRFEQQGNWLNLEVGDDGRGLDARLIRDSAVRKGLLSAAQAEALSDKEAHELIFRSGFSTAGQISAISGRGVGMDVVRQAVRDLRGMIEIHAVPGSGTRFLLTLPLTLGASPMMLLRAGRSLVGMPTQAVESVFKAEAGQLERVGEEWRLRWAEQWLRLADLSAVLGLRASGAPEPGQPIVLLQSQGKKLALMVESVEGDAELVIAPLPEGTVSEAAFQGAALHAGAELMLVLRPDWLIDHAAGRGGAARGLRALVIDDSLTARAMHRGILESGGWVVHAAASGAEGLKLLESGSYDVIICDVSMEGMDGLEFTRAVKGGAHPLATPVVLVSAHDSEEDRARGLQAGAESFISKRDCAAGRLLDEVARARAAAAGKG